MTGLASFTDSRGPDHVLPRLLALNSGAGQRAVVLCDCAEQLAALDSYGKCTNPGRTELGRWRCRPTTNLVDDGKCATERGAFPILDRVRTGHDKLRSDGGRARN
jgi:hypothetical protein